MAQAPKATKDQELLFVGSACNLDSCKLNDFLPIKCPHCAHTFCSSHFLPESHHCDKWDPSAHNRVAPNCPFCNVPVAYPSGGDPNAAMERHFESTCEALGRGGSSPKGSGICAQVRCNKALIVPIVCQSCNKKFCPEHRFHKCTMASSSAAAPKAIPMTAKGANTSRSGVVLSLKPKNANGNLPGERQQPSGSKVVPAPEPSTSALGKAGSGWSGRAPFSKTDRRAKAEQKSSMMALRERARKGLLTEDETVKLATMEASKARGKEDGCIIV